MAEPFIEHSFTCMVEKVSKYAIFLLDRNGIILTWNPAATAIKGYEAEEIIGQHYGLLYTDDARREHHPEKNLEHAAEHGTFEEEAWRQRKDGSLFWALVEIIAIRTASGELTGFASSRATSPAGAR